MNDIRVVACCGAMVLVSGLERMTFEVLRVLRESGAQVHCILNSWENHRIRELVDSIAASWSTGYYWHRFDRHARNPLQLLRLSWDIFMTSLGLLRDSARFGATHVLVPDHISALRNAPALLVLRSLGTPVVLRMANAPERGRFYEILWRWVVPPLVSRMVANSRFTFDRCLELKVPRRKLRLIRNCVSRQFAPTDGNGELLELVRKRRTLLCVGQIAPFKGTHIAIEAALALLEKGVDAQLVIVGAEPVWPSELATYAREIRDKVGMSEYRNSFHFVGMQKNVLEIMGESYLLLAPILQEETFGNVILEAKSVGLPVVAFPRGGIPELIEHERTGYLCKTLDRDGLLQGIEFFLGKDDAWRRAREECRTFFRDPQNPYSASVFAGAWQDLFSTNGASG